MLWYEWGIAALPYVVTCGPLIATFWMMDDAAVSLVPDRSVSEIQDEIREHLHRIDRKWS